MPLSVDWKEISLRLVLTLVAGFLIGLNRGERGRSAGLRTTLLVCLAASVSMIQVNLLLVSTGKSADSFVVLDLMRLPLGILSGMGFIGGGAILKRDDLALGVTTAATLWFVTVIGLCFGGGQTGLGVASTLLALLVLGTFKRLEKYLPRKRRGSLILDVDPSGPSIEEVRSSLVRQGWEVDALGISYDHPAGLRTFRCELCWKTREDKHPDFVESLAHHAGVVRLDWKPHSAASPK